MSGHGAAIAGLAMVTACAVQEPPGPAPGEPIAEVALDQGGVVQFFETRSGAIQIVQSAPSGAPDVTSTARSAVALYQRLAPERDVPPALVEAQQRVDLARASELPRTAKPTAGLDRPIANLADNTAFQTTYCTGPASIIRCVVDRATSFVAEDSSADSARCTVSVDAGAVTFVVRERGSEIWRRDLVAGQTTAVLVQGILFGGDIRCEVGNVGPGDRFDAAFVFD